MAQIISLAGLAARYPLDADASETLGGTALTLNNSPTFSGGGLNLVRTSSQSASRNAAVGDPLGMGPGVSMTALSFIAPIQHTSNVFYKGTSVASGNHEYGMTVGAATNLVGRFSNFTNNILPSTAALSVMLSALNMGVITYTDATRVGTAQVFNSNNPTGSAIATGTLPSGSIADTGQPFSLGVIGASTAFMDGIIYLTLIFKRVLEAAELLTFYNAGVELLWPYGSPSLPLLGMG